MIRYGEFRPTSLDHHIPIEDREEWFVAPVSRTRDTGVLKESNFIVALDMLGGESAKVEVHRFGHWGPGWFEIILIHPDLQAKGEEIEAKLEDYPILDEDDYSERCFEMEQRSWSLYGADDCRRALEKEFALKESTLEWLTEERLWELQREYADNPQHEDEGVLFDEDWIAELSREDLAKWVWKRRQEERQKLITHNPSVCGGSACIEGTRIPLWTLHELRSMGASDSQIQTAYPLLSSEQLAAALDYISKNLTEIVQDSLSQEEGESGPIQK